MVETGSVGFIRKENSEEVIGSRGRSSSSLASHPAHGGQAFP